jgi:hypothetical protein
MVGRFAFNSCVEELMKYYRAPFIMSLPPPTAEAGRQPSAVAFISKVVLAAIAIALAAAAIVAAPSIVLRVLGYVMLLGLIVAALMRTVRRLSVPRVPPSNGAASRQEVGDAPDFGMTG